MALRKVLYVKEKEEYEEGKGYHKYWAGPSNERYGAEGYQHLATFISQKVWVPLPPLGEIAREGNEALFAGLESLFPSYGDVVIEYQGTWTGSGRFGNFPPHWTVYGKK
ncbi:MAG: hypothetical protein HYY37_05845 [Candidatus Aenigmarchaeota archaeon]|nr:hypothetical protein [Candidatus Aenigmarchaeota archaeon]